MPPSSAGTRRRAAPQPSSAPVVPAGVAAPGGDWRKRLRYARKALGLRQQALAALAGISCETLRGYENGRRRPRRENLAAVVTALRMDHRQQRQMFEDAGFSPDPRVSPDLMQRISHTLESAIAECERHAWPAFVVNEFVDVCGANAAALRLWQLSLPPGAGGLERNMVTIATDPRFIRHVRNLDELLPILFSVFKGHDWAPESIEKPGPYLSAIIERFREGDPRDVQRFVSAWRDAPIAWERKEHWSYPIVWKQDRTTLRFDAVVTSASLIDGLTIHDWIPVDAKTWTYLRKLERRQPDPAPTPTSRPAPPRPRKTDPPAAARRKTRRATPTPARKAGSRL